MVVQILNNVTESDIKRALDKIKKQKKKKRGFPDIDKFFGVIETQDFVEIQKKMRDEWE